MSMHWVLFAVSDETYARRYRPSVEGRPDPRAVERMRQDIDAWEAELEAENLPPEEGMTNRGVHNVRMAAQGLLAMPMFDRLASITRDEASWPCRHYTSAETRALLEELRRFAALAPDSQPMEPDAHFQADYLDRVAAAADSGRGLWAWFA